MSIRGLKKWALLLTFWVALQTRCLKASPITGDTVTGDFTATGNADIQGTTLNLGTNSALSSPGWLTLYTDGSTSVIEFDASRSGNVWKWQQNGGTSLQEQMSLDNNNNLVIYSAGASPTAQITLNPGGTSTITGSITLNGTDNQMPSQTLTGSGSVLTEGLADSRYISSSSSTLAWGPSVSATGTSSVALGYNAVANGNYSFASGSGSATGDYSTAMGHSETFGGGATAMGYSYAYGNFSTASGYSSAGDYYSTAMGLSNANVWGSTAIGHSTASGYWSTALGQSTTSSTYSTAMGHSTASGYASTAMGWSTANGDYSTASGYHATASGNFSTASGLYTTAQAYDSFVMGTYNVGGFATGGDTTWIATDPLLELGNGTDSSHKSDALVVYKNGSAAFQGPVTVAPGGDIPMFTGN